MKSALVIGLGRFGRHFAAHFASLGHEVMVVDSREDLVNAILPQVTGGQIADAANEDFLRTLGVRDFDFCLVGIAGNFESALEIVAILKELGAKCVLAKAGNERHGRLLLRCGADQVIYPEKEMGRKLATRLAARNMFDYIELTPEYAIYEIPTPASWVGKSIIQLNVRAKYQVSILAIKNGDDTLPMPGADHVFSAQEHLLILATHKALDRLPE